MTAYKVEISLRVHHPNDDLASLVTAIGTPPSQIWKKGDPRRTPKGKLLGGTRDESYCSIPLKVRRKSSLADALRESLQTVKGAKKHLRKIVASGGRVVIALGWFCKGDAGSNLPSDLLTELGQSSIDLDVYLYFAANELGADE